jgi:hypothetical protein
MVTRIFLNREQAQPKVFSLFGLRLIFYDCEQPRQLRSRDY